MNILYLNMQGVLGETGRALERRGHNLVLRTGCVEALETLRAFAVDALVIEDDKNAPEILHFTVEAHQSRPALPIFVANTWGRGLLRAVEQFGRMGTDCGEEDAEFTAIGRSDLMHVQEFGRNL